jgi:hypothetical protein
MLLAQHVVLLLPLLNVLGMPLLMSHLTGLWRVIMDCEPMLSSTPAEQRGSMLHLEHSLVA